jgi:dihydrofolate reductase
MRLTARMFLTLDGILQSPGARDEDRNGYDRGGWQAPFGDEEGFRLSAADFDDADAILLGRKTYDIFAGFWPHQPDSDVFAEKLNRLPKYVASTTLTEPTWHNTSVLEGDVRAAVAELKRAPGRELQVHGSGELVRSLLRDGLLDEYRIWIHPVVLGRGKRLFDDDSPMTAFELVDVKHTEKGVVMLTYRPTGTPQFGTMGDFA